MQTTLVFTHRLDLALRLVDTTSGKNIPSTELTVLIDGDPATFGKKEDEILVFQQLHKRQFLLETRSRLFEDGAIEVDLDKLNKAEPLLELHLVPSREYPGAAPFLELTGMLPGLQELSAVHLSSKSCLIREFDLRRRQLQMFNPHHLSLDRLEYGLVDPDQNVFEPFRILRQINDQTVKVDRVLETEFRNYFSIAPVVFGKVFPDGRYCLRVRDQASDANWLVRWTCSGGEPQFRVLDFHDTAVLKLEEGGGG